MSWILVLYFTCEVGCGAPVSVALPYTYATQQECTEVGNVALIANANPTQALASFSCGNGSGGDPDRRAYDASATKTAFVTID